MLRASGSGIATAPGEVKPIYAVAVPELSPCGTEPPKLDMQIGGQNPSNNEDKCENEGTDKSHRGQNPVPEHDVERPDHAR